MIFSLALAADDFYMRNLRHHITRLAAESAYKWLLLRAEVLLTLLLCSFFAQGKDYAETWTTTTTISSDRVVNGNLKIKAGLTINLGKTLTVYGDVDIESYYAQNISGCLYIAGGNLTIDGKDGVLNFYLKKDGMVIVSDRRKNGDVYDLYDGTGNFKIISHSKSHYAVLNYNGGDLYVYNDFTQVDYATNSGNSTHTIIKSDTNGKLYSEIYIGGNYIIEEEKNHGHTTDIVGTDNYLPYVNISGNVDNKISDAHMNSVHTENISISALLPIELLSFTVSATKYGYTFNWVTTSEIENDYFTLECSEDGEEFIAIDYVHGAGTTSETTEYKYVWERKPKNETLYFRLKQTDYNGKYSYSDILVYTPTKNSESPRTLRYGPLNLQVVDGQLRYIMK